MVHTRCNLLLPTNHTSLGSAAWSGLVRRPSGVFNTCMLVFISRIQASPGVLSGMYFSAGKGVEQLHYNSCTTQLQQCGSYVRHTQQPESMYTPLYTRHTRCYPTRQGTVGMTSSTAAGWGSKQDRLACIRPHVAVCLSRQSAHTPAITAPQTSAGCLPHCLPAASALRQTQL